MMSITKNRKTLIKSRPIISHIFAVMSIRTTFWLLGLLVATGCNKETPTRWETHTNAPLAYGQLNLSNFMADSLLQENADGTISLRYMETLLEIGVDSLYSFTPDTVYRSWNLPVSINAPPNVLLFTQAETFDFNNDEAFFTFAELNRGRIAFFISNELETDVVFEYDVPQALLHNEPLSVNLLVPASHDGQAGQLTFELDLNGYHMNLTGESGNDYNTLATNFSVRTPDNGQQSMIASNKNITLNVIYSDLGIEYAQGYFNTTTLNIGEESTYFAGLSELSGAILNLSSANAKLKFTNDFGVDLQAVITNLALENSVSGLNVSLENAVFNSPINISRSLLINDMIQPYIRNLEFNDDNSNISSFLEIIGDSLQFAGTVVLNPLGNISNFNDFVTGSGHLKAELDVEIPLNFSVSNLVLRDTFVVNSNGSVVAPESGTLYVRCKNDFPMDVRLEISALSSVGSEIINLDDYLTSAPTALVSGRLPAGTDPSWTLLKYEFGPDAFESVSTADSFVITATFQTTNYPNHVTITAEQKIELLISSELELPIEIK